EPCNGSKPQSSVHIPQIAHPASRAEACTICRGCDRVEDAFPRQIVGHPAISQRRIGKPVVRCMRGKQCKLISPGVDAGTLLTEIEPRAGKIESRAQCDGWGWLILEASSEIASSFAEAVRAEPVVFIGSSESALHEER